MRQEILKTVLKMDNRHSSSELMLQLKMRNYTWREVVIINNFGHFTSGLQRKKFLNLAHYINICIILAQKDNLLAGPAIYYLHHSFFFLFILKYPLNVQVMKLQLNCPPWKRLFLRYCFLRSLSMFV